MKLAALNILFIFLYFLHGECRDTCYSFNKCLLFIICMVNFCGLEDIKAVADGRSHHYGARAFVYVEPRINSPTSRINNLRFVIIVLLVSLKC